MRQPDCTYWSHTAKTWKKTHERKDTERKQHSNVNRLCFPNPRPGTKWIGVYTSKLLTFKGVSPVSIVCLSGCLGSNIHNMDSSIETTREFKTCYLSFLRHRTCNFVETVWGAPVSFTRAEPIKSMLGGFRCWRTDRCPDFNRSQHLWGELKWRLLSSFWLNRCKLNSQTHSKIRFP